MQVGDQVGHCHVEKVAGGKREHVGERMRHRLRGEDHRNRAEDSAEARQQVQREGAQPRVAGAQEDRDVAHLLRNLVRGDGERGRDAERHRRDDRGGNHGAVHERMECVADDHEGGGAAGVHLALVRVVAVTPQHELFEEEEREDACEQRRHRLRASRLASASGRSASSATPSSVPTA